MAYVGPTAWRCLVVAEKRLRRTYGHLKCPPN